MGANLNAINLFMTWGDMKIIYNSSPKNHDIFLGIGENVDEAFFKIINHNFRIYLSKLKLCFLNYFFFQCSIMTYFPIKHDQ